MKFQEHNRKACRDGSVHVFSVAYAAVEAFIQADDDLVALDREELELHRRHNAMIEARMAAAEAMANALEEHYEGRVPRVVLFSNRMVIIDDSGDALRYEVTEPGGWSDLFRIERPDDAAQTAPAAAEAAADE